MPRICRVFKTSITAISIAALMLLPVHRAVGAKPLLFGISTGGSLLNMSEANLDKRFDDMKQLGVSWVRVDFSWSVIQPDDSWHYDYQFHDKVVAAAAKASIRILAVVAYTPAWARDSRCTEKTPAIERQLQKCKPQDAGEFAHFSKEVAERYRSAIAAWEVWNEPNLVGYWRQVNDAGNIAVDPVTYANLVNLTADAIHQVLPEATIITGGLAPLFEPSAAKGMRQSDFLRDMLPRLDSGGANAIGVHPYSWPALPAKAADWNAFYTVDNGNAKRNLRSIVASAGRQELAFWATEYGAPTVGKITVAARKHGKRPDHVTEQTQAKIMRQGIELWRNKPNSGPLFVHSDSDNYLPKKRHQDGFGLRRRDGSPKPAYTLLRSTFGK